MSPPVLEHILDRHPLCEVVKLQGLGEPMLGTTLVDLCNVVMDRDLLLDTTINGTVVNWAAVPMFNRITVSLDTLDEQKYEKIRPGADLSQVIDNILDIVDMGVCVWVNQVLSDVIDKSDIDDVRRFCNDNDITYNKSVMENWHHDRYDPHVECARIKWGSVFPRKYHCSWGSKWFYYDVHGNEHPCCMRMNSEYTIRTPQDRRRWCDTCPY